MKFFDIYGFFVRPLLLVLNVTLLSVCTCFKLKIDRGRNSFVQFALYYSVLLPKKQSPWQQI